jgi:hypothetical protein
MWFNGKTKKNIKQLDSSCQCWKGSPSSKNDRQLERDGKSKKKGAIPFGKCVKNPTQKEAQKGGLK